MIFPSGNAYVIYIIDLFVSQKMLGMIHGLFHARNKML